ncbi:MAG: HIT family protein [Candidatus Nanohaloarchaea archaeon]
MDCIFCEIANGEQDAFKVYEDERTVAFLDVNPASKGHTVVIPKDHAEDLYSMEPEDTGAVFRTAREVASAIEDALDPEGMNMVQSNGKKAGQEIDHMHVHLVPRYGGDEVKIEFRPGDLEEPAETVGKILDEI